MPFKTISPQFAGTPPRLRITDVECHVLLAPDYFGARVLCADPYLDWTLPLGQVLRESDALVRATPHAAYRWLEPKVPCVDVWGIVNDPELEVFRTGPQRETRGPR